MNTFLNIRSSFLVVTFISSFIIAQGNGITINVMTYNIQQGSHYNPQTTPQAVAEIIIKNEIDFLGSQELHIDGVKSLSSLLPNYEWFGVGRDNGKEVGETGCIFFDSSKYKLLEQSTFWLSTTPDVIGSKSWNAADVRIVTWGKFLVVSDSSIVYLFNTHYDHISSLARLESSKLLLKKIYEIAGMNPVIVTGDFNMISSSQEYNLLVDDYYNYLHLYDAQSKSVNGSTGPPGTFNNFTTNYPTEKIDFIFVNPFFDVITHAVLTDKYDNGEFISDHFPVRTQLKLKYPSAPITPELITVSGNNKVTLYWNSISEKETVETFTDSTNDFQGYKLYKSRTPGMEDAVLVPGKWDIPLLRDPLFECDLIDDKQGYTNYGIVNGFGYYLGDNSGIQHFYIDEDVQNGQTYYYVLIAYDHGIPGMADGFPPMETPFILNVNADGNILNKSSNVGIAKPEEPTQEKPVPGVTLENNITGGTGTVSVKIIDPLKLKNGRYKIKFDVDTLNYNAVTNPKYRSNRDIYFVNTGINVISMKNDSVIYKENRLSYSARNLVLNPYLNYYFLNTTEPVTTDEIDGFQVVLDDLVERAEFDTDKSGWKTGNSNIQILPSSKEAYYFPWNCEIRFGEQYTGRTSTLKSIYDANGNIVAYTQLLLNHTFDFSVVSKDFPDEKLDLVVYDTNLNGLFDYGQDKVLAGYCVQLANKVYWAGTVFSISFEYTSGNLPVSGDVYELFFKKPFLDSDEIVFSVDDDITSVSPGNDQELITDFSLSQNYPNPFNPTTTIRYTIHTPTFGVTSREGNQKGVFVTLKVYDILGREVTTLVNDFQQPGKYSVQFNVKTRHQPRQGGGLTGGASLPSGVYFYTLRVSPLGNTGREFQKTKKMLLLK